MNLFPVDFRPAIPIRMVLVGLVLVGLAAFPPAARAQIVNIESILTGQPRSGVQGALQLGFNLQRGNTEYRELEGNGIVRWRTGAHLLQLVAGGSYRTARSRKVSDNAMGHLRYGLFLSDHLRFEAFAQLQRDAFVRLRRRLLVGAGLRTALFSRPVTDPEGAELERRFDLGLIVMHEAEELQGGLSTDGWRGSILLSIGWGVTADIFFGTQIYLQPLLGRRGDYRMLGDGSVQIRLLGPLSLQTGFRVVHDSRPPAGVKNTDLALRNTLAIVF